MTDRRDKQDRITARKGHRKQSGEKKRRNRARDRERDRDTAREKKKNYKKKKAVEVVAAEEEEVVAEAQGGRENETKSKVNAREMKKSIGSDRDRNWRDRESQRVTRSEGQKQRDIQR